MPGSAPENGRSQEFYRDLYSYPELDRIHLAAFTGPAGTFRQRTGLTKPAGPLFAQLGITLPR